MWEKDSLDKRFHPHAFFLRNGKTAGIFLALRFQMTVSIIRVAKRGFRHEKINFVSNHIYIEKRI